MTPDDLRAAVAGGILTGAKAAAISVLARERTGQRATLPAEDEPFEFFRGFSDIFVSVGLMMLLTGILTAGLIVVLTVTDSIVPNRMTTEGFASFLDRRVGSGLAIGLLLFGILAFMGGMWFDMHDPHRLVRQRVLAAYAGGPPALVNTIMLTLYNYGGTLGYLLTALGLALVALLALAIDRRSFLTAGIGYLGLLIGWALDRGNTGAPSVLILLVLGSTITALGTWWVPLRAGVMQALPDFPGKARLPPHGADPVS